MYVHPHLGGAQVALTIPPVQKPDFTDEPQFSDHKWATLHWQHGVSAHSSFGRGVFIQIRMK